MALARRLCFGLTVWLLALLGGCSGDDADGAKPNADAGAETGGDGGLDAPAEAGISLGICNSPADIESQLIPNSYIEAAIQDCRVQQVFLSLTPDEGTAFIERLQRWSSAFFGCPLSPGGVTTFGPADTGKNPTLSQADVDVLSDHYVAQLKLFVKPAASELALIEKELAVLAKAAVNSPGPGHSFSLCVDAGSGDAGGDATPDVGSDVVVEAASDAASDATEADGGGDSGAAD